MDFAGNFLASEAGRMSSHMLSVPCGALDSGFHSARFSSGARGSPATAAAGERILFRRFQSSQNHLLLAKRQHQRL